ncbi:prepilin peptidase-dependent pilin [Prodigiosinella confusarubida]|uniref:Prepilin peptidase-dependent pilin n=1 Tax=Serratia sp. (strain ATCC 39006) TaxID=104623 RepID=A0A2I5TGT5_SERS3|nr:MULTISPECIES: prepilin peptidase-dependent pilin [Enterobacterales]AUG99451.1 prepilin peptidase-dependent pilin [Serratia sp. ATCC 39006]AUH03769.1 prepilin peptidase-dependent pilin [Serratia sp. ATCC 39006]WJV56144.1 prepilin peptidase-dependent pilin [Prodigiosinella sp. LS101]WJV60512.1 prepilin peptidase-dependent pilin [Pectobacteriaceae bacterium C111]
MVKQHGFTLIELMVVIVIIAILSSLGIPAYQGYLQKAAMTDMLQTMVSYKTTIDLCGLSNASFATCNAGSQGIPTATTSRYVSASTVSQGSISLTGQSTLQGLRVVMTPSLDVQTGASHWTRDCQTDADAESLRQACQDVFRFDNTAG